MGSLLGNHATSLSNDAQEILESDPNRRVACDLGITDNTSDTMKVCKRYAQALGLVCTRSSDAR